MKTRINAGWKLLLFRWKVVFYIVMLPLAIGLMAKKALAQGMDTIGPVLMILMMVMQSCSQQATNDENGDGPEKNEDNNRLPPPPAPPEEQFPAACQGAEGMVAKGTLSVEQLQDKNRYTVSYTVTSCGKAEGYDIILKNGQSQTIARGFVRKNQEVTSSARKSTDKVFKQACIHTSSGDECFKPEKGGNQTGGAGTSSRLPGT
ncbi:hypothetical protein HY642_01860 [Candidatus Woesearchaeota archaeon]|nr:hypothetical protein [Candidatus Woesearchaeota archaeon]